MAGRDDEGEEDAPAMDAGSRFGRMARRLMDRKELAEDTRDLVSALLSTSDRAKTEAVKMVAREVRAYLDELKLKEDMLEYLEERKLKEDIVELLSGYSLEMSISLKPLAPEVKAANAKIARGEPDESVVAPIGDSPTVKLTLPRTSDTE